MSANRDDSDDATGSNGANDSGDDKGDDKKPPGLSTTEMLWILLAIAAVMLISRVMQNLF